MYFNIEINIKTPIKSSLCFIAIEKTYSLLIDEIFKICLFSKVV